MKNEQSTRSLLSEYVNKHMKREASICLIGFINLAVMVQFKDHSKCKILSSSGYLPDGVSAGTGWTGVGML